VVETIAGRANLLATHPLNIGPVGVTGSDSANAIAEKADVIIAVGTGCRISPPGLDGLRKDAQSSSGSMPRAMTRQAPVAAGGGRREAGLEALDEAIGGYKARPTGPLSRKPSANGTPMSPTMWRTATGPTPMRRRSAW
jgi:3D-(3,5/4)-trihydroxycyclohexane-1,2-dione acylhydrolase (decyclizing)